MIKVFFSASEKSKSHYSGIHQKLESMDKSRKIKLIHFPGFNYVPEQNYFPKAIMMAIEDSDIVVALMDKEGRKNQWINQEVGYAMAKDIHVLALAESMKELKGFVNMYTKTVVEGDEISLPEGMEKWLTAFEKEIEEELYTKLIKDNILEMKRRINWERYQFNFIKPSDKQRRILDNFNTNIRNLENSYSNYNFFTIESLDTINKTIDQIHKAGFNKGFSKFCAEFCDPLENLIKSRTIRYQFTP